YAFGSARADGPVLAARAACGTPPFLIRSEDAGQTVLGWTALAANPQASSRSTRMGSSPPNCSSSRKELAYPYPSLRRSWGSRNTPALKHGATASVARIPDATGNV